MGFFTEFHPPTQSCGISDDPFHLVHLLPLHLSIVVILANLVIYCWPNSQINYLETPLSLIRAQILRNSYLVRRRMRVLRLGAVVGEPLH